MPDNQPKLPDTAIAKIEQWIELGAPYDQPLIEGKKPPRDAAVVTDEDRRWWSFLPLANATTPTIKQPAQAPTPLINSSSPKLLNKTYRFHHR